MASWKPGNKTYEKNMPGNIILFSLLSGHCDFILSFGLMEEDPWPLNIRTKHKDIVKANPLEMPRPCGYH